MKMKFLKNMKREERGIFTLFVVLLVVVIVYFAGNAIFDLVAKNKEKRNAPALKKILTDFDKDSVFKIQIDQKETGEIKASKTILAKTDGNWAFVLPESYTASASTVQSYLLALSSLEYTARIDKVDAEVLDITGLKDPETTITLTASNGELVIQLGAETPTKDGVYVKVGTSVYTMDAYYFQALLTKTSDFREKRIFNQIPIMELSYFEFSDFIDNIQNIFTLENNTWIWKSNFTKDYMFSIENLGIEQLRRSLLSFGVEEFVDEYREIENPDYVIRFRSMDGKKEMVFYLVESDEKVLPIEKTYTIYDIVNKLAYKAHIRDMYSYFTEKPAVFFRAAEEDKQEN